MPKRELTEEELALRAGLGAAIRAASGQRGLKPADLAAAAGVALSQQYRIENGELTADFLYLVKIARLLDLSVDSLIHAAQSTVKTTGQGAAGISQTQYGKGTQIGHNVGDLTIGAPPGSRRKKA